ncbi:hypothetical protein MAR_005448 [Mya arenaria]|uniref:Uncharacterized protein n=1 Tax=Mya arenaria TaxID=6604 RepID=A0ABY7EZK0_MYAAR|nr:hypothetical protein MAR_005448 [Mya arenaria]
MLVLSIIAVGAQIFVISHYERSSRYCEQPLLTLQVISIILSSFTVVFLLVVFPFWLVNAWKTGIVMDPYSRTGICYEPAKCCTCIWHI